MKESTLLAVGDLILPPEGEPYFDHVREVLRNGDVVIGQLEVPHTEKDPHAVSLGRIPENLKPLLSSGFDIVTMAGNHVKDAGDAGIEDTVEWLKNNGIGHVGAGMNINEARKPLLYEKNGTVFGVLNYNCVGPKETWATESKPGNAYLRIFTHYEENYATPGGPPTIYTWAERKNLLDMEEDIGKIRPYCDILIVAFHKGIGHTPVKLAQYDHQVSYAAINAGADLVLAHHAHILKGIEVYKGKAIFHGLGNFVTHVPIEAFQKNSKLPASWAKKRKELFGFEPDPEYPTYPFHPEARNTIIAKCVIEGKKIVKVGYIPCVVNKEGKPEIAKRESTGQNVFDYVKKITHEAELSTEFVWDGDEVEVIIDGSKGE